MRRANRQWNQFSGSVDATCTYFCRSTPSQRGLPNPPVSLPLSLAICNSGPAIVMILRFTCVAALALPPLTNGRAHNPRSAFVAHAAAAAGYTGRIFHLPAQHPSSPRRPSSPRTTSAPSMVATQTLPPLDSPAGARLKEEGVTQRDWAALLEAGGVDTLREGQLLISQGDVYEDPENREVYLLLQGECQIEVRGRPVGKMGPGEFVGEGERRGGGGGGFGRRFREDWFGGGRTSCVRRYCGCLEHY